MTGTESREYSRSSKTETVVIIFEVTEADEGGYNARALGHSIFTQGDDSSDLEEMVRDAVLCHFDESEVPNVIRLRSVTQETIAILGSAAT